MRLYSAFADMEYCFPAVFVCLDAHIRLMLCILRSLNIDNKKLCELCKSEVWPDNNYEPVEIKFWQGGYHSL